ncbi:hypothetical protein F511_28541 [Dorcoceras hygrometricum]|uniref:CRM domain-containing protein n=1 Tax=Dorcoceras hygrometricum TaxID=472368 RepID=A0A2Z7AWH0_9LAMI|nr:hypothetical protein F511_28541 [Dorcoceras hygrometricum]
MATGLASSSQVILRRFVLPFLPPSPCPFLQAKQSLHLKTKPCLTSSRTLRFFPTAPRAVSQRLQDDVAVLDIEEIDSEIDIGSSADASEGLKGVLGSKIGGINEAKQPPSLSVKEKKELASYAHSLCKKLKSQQVGKSGVTHTVVTALIETLEANELLKLKIHGTCPGELDDVLKQLEVTTGAAVVGQIGRTVILYRPSVAKLKAEEKRQQVQRAYLKRQPILKQFPKSERPRRKTGSGQEQRKLGAGRRGSSRN